jgi:hypothetical protein
MSAPVPVPPLDDPELAPLVARILAFMKSDPAGSAAAAAHYVAMFEKVEASERATPDFQSFASWCLSWLRPAAAGLHSPPDKPFRSLASH